MTETGEPDSMKDRLLAGLNRGLTLIAVTEEGLEALEELEAEGLAERAAGDIWKRTGRATSSSADPEPPA